jgi:ATP phosphoribosyltransferase regulatory subunit
MTSRAEQVLVELFAQAGYPRADAALLQPAGVFIDLSGEDIRRRLYLTQDADGRELCLRPEFTIPLCLDAAARGLRAADIGYFGPVFRHRPGERGEFLQAGVESLGRTDRAAADAEIVALAVESAERLGHRAPSVRLGDVALLQGVLNALGVAPSFARRLKRRLAAGKLALPPPAQEPARASAGLDQYAGVLAALEGAGPAAARAFVTDMLAMTGVEVSGGRSVGEIAERFLAKAREGDAALPAEKRLILERFLALEGDPDSLADGLRKLAADANLGLSGELDAYEARTGFMAARGIDTGRITAEAAFLRNLDYYTGMIFEIADPALGAGKPLVGGGRYDGLLGKLGADEPTPAVGFAVWVERFAPMTDAGGAA